MPKIHKDSFLFHSQIRVGKNNKSIVVSKIRTMKRDAHSTYDSIFGKKATQNRDAFDAKNTTRIGRVLRKTKLDEAPQIWNLLKGEISLVGVRPLARQDYRRLPSDVKEMYAKFGPGLFAVYSAIPKKQRSWNKAIQIYREFYKAKEKNKLKANTKYLLKIFWEFFSSPFKK